MTTKQDLTHYVESEKKQHYDGAAPVYAVCVCENVTGEPNDILFGAMDEVGFFYDLTDAIRAVRYNECDIREYVYDGAFVIARFPGLYNCVGPEGRMFFVWNDEKKEYVPSEEPDSFQNIAF